MNNDIESFSYVSTKRLDDILLLVAISISKGDIDELPTAREVAYDINKAKQVKQDRLLKNYDEETLTIV